MLRAILLLQWVTAVRVIGAEVPTNDKRHNDAGGPSQLADIVGLAQQGLAQVWPEALGRVVALADGKGLDAGVAAALGLGTQNTGEEDTQLVVEKCHISAAKDLGHEAASWL